MKTFTIIFFLQVLSCQVSAQLSDIFLEKMFNAITHPPHCIIVRNDSTMIKEVTPDISYLNIIKNRKSSIPYLIRQLTDTTDTEVFSQFSKRYLKRSDLALLLINDIEQIPFAKITQIQWCICCDCFNFPVDFFQYFDKNRLEFYENYRDYFYSNRRNKKLVKSQ